MPDSISVTFTYAASEYVRAIRRHYWAMLRVIRSLIIAVVAVVGGILLVGFTDTDWIGYCLVVVGMVLLAMTFFALFVLPRRIYRSDPKLRNQYALTFSDDAIHFKTLDIDSTLQWSLYHSWSLDDEFYVLYHGKRDLTVIPKRTLSDRDDELFRGMLRRQIGIPRS